MLLSIVTAEFRRMSTSYTTVHYNSNLLRLGIIEHQWMVGSRASEDLSFGMDSFGTVIKDEDDTLAGLSASIFHVTPAEDVSHEIELEQHPYIQWKLGGNGFRTQNRTIPMPRPYNQASTCNIKRS
ncbi:hypothetical protein AVEN_170887-1 [Araneus ventricosus]|uniref:Uncharacterized protein n=1 Tax=Araneus ventricosus TaxID=182803 RepID=A0A4Y2J994_ARAVE|nr:hypothetical protein AVEN_170887-1 [Araneus ventricosus]